MLDTPAYAALFRVKYTGSLRCPCCRMPGFRIKELKTTAYNYHSMFLPDSNFVKVAPINYNADTTSFLCSSNELLGEYIVFEKLQGLVKYFSNNQKHEKYRPYNRVHRRTYLQDAIEAEMTRYDKRINSFLKKDEINVNGVKGLTPFASLHNFDIGTQTSGDPMHAAMNIGRHTLRQLSGKRACSEKLHTYCKDKNIHPSIKKTANDKSWIADWTLSSESTRNKITTWVNCLLAPIGHKDNFQVENVFKKDGFLRATAVVDVLCNVLDFILYADTEYSEEYRLFFHIYSKCFSRLMGTKIDKATYEKLCENIIEITAIHDAMLPPSESTITCHQPVEIVHHIKNAGPTRCVATSGNERALKALKAFLPIGGTQIDLVTFRRYIKFETEQMNSYYSNKKKLQELRPPNNFRFVDGQWHFTDEPFFLSQLIPSGSKLNLTTDETAYMLFAITDNVYGRVSENMVKALQVSPLFRILRCYDNRAVYDEETGNKIKNQSKKLKEYSFLEWMKSVVEIFDDLDGVVYFTFKYRFIYEDPSSDESIGNQIFEKKSIYTKDVEIMRELILEQYSISYNMYSRANIFGTAFRSRGINKRETKVVRTGKYGGEKNMITLTNNANRLKEQWWKTDEYSSWCKYYDYTKPSEEKYGQINAFLQLHVPFDPFVDGICLASITSRKHIHHMHIDHIFAQNDDESLDEHLFIPVTNIKSTPILIAGFSTKAGLAELNRKMVREKKELQLPTAPDKKIKFWTKHNCVKPIYAGHKYAEHIDSKFQHFVENVYRSPPLSYLVLIEMQRNRYNAKYDKTKDNQYRKNFIPFNYIKMNKIWTQQMSLNFEYSID